MEKEKESVIYEGGCHCRAIRFQVVVEEHQAIECNCSICRKKGFLHLIVPPEKFTLLQGKEDLTTYTFNTHTAKHTFCRICGIHPFYTPRSHPNSIDVNIRTFDEDVIEKFAIQYFDGQNWEQNIETIRS